MTQWSPGERIVLSAVTITVENLEEPSGQVLMIPPHWISRPRRKYAASPLEGCWFFSVIDANSAC